MWEKSKIFLAEKFQVIYVDTASFRKWFIPFPTLKCELNIGRIWRGKMVTSVKKPGKD